VLIPIAVALVVLIPFILWIIHLVKPDFAFHWVIASLTALVVFLLVLFAKPEQPVIVLSVDWQPQALFPVSPTFLLDTVSWSLALALATMTLSVLLTASVSQTSGAWYTWAGMLILTGLGLLSVTAANPLTLMLIWSAIDIFEIVILFRWIRRSELRRRIVWVISARVFGTFFLMVTTFIEAPSEAQFDLGRMSPLTSLVMLLAAGLRLGVLPLHPPFLHDRPLRKGLGTPLRLVPVAASLVLLVRMAEFEVPEVFIPWILALTALAGIYGVVSWIIAASELSGRPYWILSVVSLCVAAAVSAQPIACLSWSLACILMGGFMFVLSSRHRALFPVMGAAIIGLSSLPFTPTWAGLGIYTSLWSDRAPYSLIFGAVQLFLLLGVVKHLRRNVDPPALAQGALWFLYTPGLLLLVVVQYSLGLTLSANLGVGEWQSWLGLIITASAGFIWLIFSFNRTVQLVSRRYQQYAIQLTRLWERIFSLEWLYQLLWVVYRVMGRIVDWFNLFLESEAGILWAVVILIFFLTISSQLIALR